MWEGVAAGVALGAANGIAAWLIIRFVWGRHDLFAKVFLGGMVLRMALVALTALLLFKYSGIGKFAFVVALMVTFVVFQVGEIVLIVRKRATEQAVDGGSAKTESAGSSGS